VLWGLVAVAAILSVLFLVQPPVLLDLWPFEGTTSMSFVLMASMLAAAAFSTGVPLILGRFGALAGVGLDVASTFLPIGVFATLLGLFGAHPEQSLLAVAAAVALFAGWVLYRRSQAIPSVDGRPMPRPVRLAFRTFTGALVVVGGLLVARIPSVLPWSVPPDLSTVFGFMFLGAATYFWYGLQHPTWDNAVGQLAGFLAYDIVLIGPFLERLPTVDPAFAVSLWLYIAVVVASAVLAVWYLLLDPRWRVVGGRARDAVPEVTTSV